jgi:hypothetical protein
LKVELDGAKAEIDDQKEQIDAEDARVLELEEEMEALRNE